MSDKKICGRCSQSLDVILFYKNKSATDGLSRLCKNCNREKVYEWREKNKEKYLEYKKEYYRTDKCLARTKEYYRRPEIVEREKIREKNRDRGEYRSEYEKRDHVKSYRKEYKNNVFNKRIEQRIRNSMTSRIRLAMIKNSRLWPKSLNYTVEELMESLQSKFTDGMSWDNYGEWQIDHIVPVSKFKIKTTGDDEFLACWDLGNLQPLWAKENQSKGAKVIDNKLYEELMEKHRKPKQGA